jgi:2-keto-3-deoxy-6-phosphogluconate aldolase
MHLAMTSTQFQTVLSTRRASAILRTSIESAAAPAMRAAIDGGFRIAEFTLTTPRAFELIREFSR